jgi:hypothetical protein
MATRRSAVPIEAPAIGHPFDASVRSLTPEMESLDGGAMLWVFKPPGCRHLASPNRRK